MEYINSSQFKLFAASIIPIHVLSTLGSDYSEHYTDTIQSFCSLVGWGCWLEAFYTLSLKALQKFKTANLGVKMIAIHF